MSGSERRVVGRRRAWRCFRGCSLKGKGDERIVKGLYLVGPRHTVQTDLVPVVADFCELLGEGLDAVSGDEPRRFDVVCFEQLKESIDSYCRPIDPARDVRGILRRAITGIDPVCHGVEVHFDENRVSRGLERPRELCSSVYLRILRALFWEA